MTAVRSILAVAGAVLLAAARAGGQQTEPIPHLALGGSEVAITPHLTVGSETLSGRGSFTLGHGSSRLLEGAAEVDTRLFAGVRLHAATIHARRVRGPEQALNRRFELGATMPRGGVSFAYDLGDAALAEFARRTRTLEVRGSVDVGVRLELAARSARILDHGVADEDTVYVVLERFRFDSRHTTEFVRSDRFVDIELGIGATLGSADVSLVAGQRMDGGSGTPQRWGFARLTVPVTERVRLLGEIGRNEGIPAIGRPPTDFGRIGFNLDLASSERGSAVPMTPLARAPARASVHTYRRVPVLVVYAPLAHVVEVRGDFTDWRPAAMERVERGRWVYRLDPGVHRIDVRIDGGEWRAPAGLPVVADEFRSGETAIVVVE